MCVECDGASLPSLPSTIRPTIQDKQHRVVRTFPQDPHLCLCRGRQATPPAPCPLPVGGGGGCQETERYARSMCCAVLCGDEWLPLSGNTLLHLFGSWLFEAAAWPLHGEGARPGSEYCLSPFPCLPSIPLLLSPSPHSEGQGGEAEQPLQCHCFQHGRSQRQP